MIRTVATSKTNILNLNILDQYVGRMLEIIAFAIDELSIGSINTKIAKNSLHLS